MEIRERYLDYINVYTVGSRDGNSVACATVFPSDTVISMKLPYLASIFTAEFWAIIKALEQIKDSVAFKYIRFTPTFVSPCFTAYEAGTYLHWDGDTKVCLYILLIKTLFFVGYPAILALGAMKSQTTGKTALDLPRVKVGVPNSDFKHRINQCILFTWQDGWNASFCQAGTRRLAVLIQSSYVCK